MSSTTDNRAARLALSGYSNESEWLLVATSWQQGPKHVNDLWRTYLDQRGFAGGGLNDDLSRYLNSVGHTEPDITGQLASWWGDLEPLPGALP